MSGAGNPLARKWRREIGDWGTPPQRADGSSHIHKEKSFEDFVAVGEGGGLLEHGRYGAVFFFAQLDGVLDGGFVQPAAEAIEKLELGPHGRRVGGAFAGGDDFERIEFLPLLFENDDDVGGGAGAKGDEEKLHRAGSFVRFAVGIESDRVARRADAEESLFANPFHGCGLHRETSEERGKDSRRRKKVGR